MLFRRAGTKREHRNSSALFLAPPAMIGKVISQQMSAANLTERRRRDWCRWLELRSRSKSIRIYIASQARLINSKLGLTPLEKTVHWTVFSSLTRQGEPTKSLFCPMDKRDFLSDAFPAECYAHCVRDRDFVCEARLRRVRGTHRITYPAQRHHLSLICKKGYSVIYYKVSPVRFPSSA